MAKRKQQRRIFKKKKLSTKIILWTLAVIIVGVFLLGLAVFAWFFKDLPRPERFAEGIFAESTKIYDKTGEILLYEVAGEEKRTIVPLEQMPDHLKWAVMTAEDRNFYEHKGLDFRAILRAIIYDLKIGAPAQGASTISQQLIRSYFLTQHKTIKRKTREIILALEMERRYSKEQIFEWYLNLIPFGSNLYGVEAVSQTFFAKPVAEISLAEAAVLAGLIRAPSRLSPYGSQLEELFNIQKYILTIMAKEGFITKEESEAAKTEKIVFSEIQHTIKAPHFVLFVKDYLEKKYGKKFLERAGLKVITTLDADLQRYAEDLVKTKIDWLTVYQAHNGGLVSINPKNGHLLVMVGSKDYFGDSFPENCSSGLDCQFDPKVNVTLRARQPGSAFKPFAYAVAFKKGFLPKTLLWDVLTEFNPDCPPDGSLEKDQFADICYHPKNYSGLFKGLLTLREALAQSRNLPAVKVLYLAGLTETLNLAKSFGITTLTNTQDYGLSLVLGGGEVKLLEMVSAYSIFANEGLRTPLTFIKSIEDKSGNILEQAKTNPIKILSSQIARQLNSILSDNAARSPVFGWNSPLYINGYQVAAKTGTTQRYNDAWTIGYTPGLVTGVWVGNNDNSEMTKSGSVLAGPIWHDFMVYALSKFPKENFIEPKILSSEKPMLNGLEPEGQAYSILHFVNKKDPVGEIPTNPGKDPQYFNWEYSIKNFLGIP